jgi:hypothetical protein
MSDATTASQDPAVLDREIRAFRKWHAANDSKLRPHRLVVQGGGLAHFGLTVESKDSSSVQRVRTLEIRFDHSAAATLQSSSQSESYVCPTTNAAIELIEAFLAAGDAPSA